MIPFSFLDGSLLDNFQGLNIEKKLCIVSWRFSSTHLCYGILQKVIFLRPKQKVFNWKA